MALVSEISKLKVEDIAKPRDPMIIVDSNDSAYSVLKLLSKNRISSAPVYDQSRKEYVGFIDLLDIVCFLVDLLSRPDLKQHASQVESVFLESQTDKIVNLSRRDEYHPVEKGTPLIEAVKLLGRDRIHRLPILHEGKIVSVLTQSALVGWLTEHMDLLSPLTQKTLHELNLDGKQVHSIHARAKCIEAFDLMAKEHVAGLAVVMEDGSLLTCISATDLKVFEHQFLLKALRATVQEFTTASRISDVSPDKPAAVTTHPEDTVEKLLGKFQATGLHRLFVTTKHGFRENPVGVITLSDVITLVEKHCILGQA